MNYKSHKEVYEDSLRIAREVLSKIKKLQLSKLEEHQFVL